MNLDIKFQILDVTYKNVEATNDDDDDDEVIKKEYVINLFGRTDTDKTVYLEVTNFKPYFYVEIDENWNRKIIDSFLETLKKKVYPSTNINGLSEYKIIRSCKFSEFTNYTKFKFIKLIFSDSDSMKAYSYAFNKILINKTISDKPIKLTLYESNIEPYLRFLHIRNIEAVGWVTIKKEDIKKSKIPSWCDINISANYLKIEPLKSNIIVPLVISAFDIECVSEDGSFPKAERENDQITQIGTTYSRYGSADCYFKHVISLNSCKKVDGCETESYETEAEVLLNWTKLIQKTNPDVIVGYNTFGFDFEYMMKRAKFLGIETEFSKLSRIKNEACEFKSKDLSSAALGHNQLKYYDMRGRVLIDLYKYIPKEYKLPSYKLDEVASTFIKGNIKDMYNEEDKEENDIKYKLGDATSDFVRGNVENIKNVNQKGTIVTDNIVGINTNDFIIIMYNDGVVDYKHMNGTKFLVEEINEIIKEDKTFYEICIDKEIDISILKFKYKISWGQAKDDMDPKELFKLQKGSDEDRSKIAKYCVKDCSLCNVLLHRLQVINNNVGMGNVCHVPLSYLFMRGQGVKIFSLVAKKCREKQHLIPVLKKKVNPKEKIISINFNNELICEKNNGIKENDLIEIAGYDSKKIEQFKVLNIIQDKNNRYHIKIQGKTQFKIGKKGIFFTKTDKKLTEKQINEKKFELFIESLNNPDKFSEEEDFSFEGANVFEPKTGIHMNPIPVLDFTSLYPTSMIYMDLSHERFVKDFEKYGNLEGYGYNKIMYCTEEITKKLGFKNEIIEGYKKNGYIIKETTEIIKNKKYNVVLAYDKEEILEKMVSKIVINKQEITIMNYQVSIFAYKLNGEKAIIPEILQTILDTRKKCKKEMDAEPNKFIRAILDGRQLALKITANSLYGQTGAPTSPIFMRPIAASTTKIGRQMLDFSKAFIENYFGNFVNSALESKKLFIEKFNDAVEKITLDRKAQEYKLKNQDSKNYTNKDEFIEYFYKKVNEILVNKSVKMEIIYGDTDSIFINPNIIDKTTNLIMQDKEALKLSILLGILSSQTIGLFLPLCMSQEYEKVLWPFILLTKKKYVGNLYEKDPETFNQKSMGIVLKRRDNAPIVKIICSGIIDQILNKRDPKGAVKQTKINLKNMLAGKVDFDKFIITKTLRDNYKNENSQIHCMIAKKMTNRDSGNVPKSNDRISYAFIKTDLRKVKYKHQIAEEADYIKKNKIELDYVVYIRDQIMNPACQFLELIIEEPEKLFNKYIIKETNKRKGIKSIEYYIDKANKDNEKKNVVN